MSERKTVKKKKKWGKVYEYTPLKREIVLTDEMKGEIEKDLKNLRPTTPESFASKHNIKVSLAKQILNDQVDEGNLTLVHSGPKTAIYQS